MAKIVCDEIDFVGLNDLPLDEQETVKKITERYFPKIKHTVKNIARLTVHIKVYDTTGSERKHSLHIHLAAPGKMFETNKHHGFDVSKALHEAFDALIREIEHHYHNDGSKFVKK